MKIVKLQQSYLQELQNTVNIELLSSDVKVVLTDVQCYDNISGLFAKCLGWSLEIHDIDSDGIISVYYVKKESLQRKAFDQSLLITNLVKKCTLWVDERSLTSRKVE